MGRIVVSQFVSLDGVMEAPGGEPGYAHTGWVFDYEDPEQMQFKYEEVVEASAQLVGRVTYESFAQSWPTIEGEFGDRMNAMPKYVASTTLTSSDWNNTHILHGDTAEAIRRLKAEIEGDILVPGSISLSQFLKQEGLVDEYRLMMFPIVLGSGRRLWGATENTEKLHLKGSRTFKNGTVLLTYDAGRE